MNRDVSTPSLATRSRAGAISADQSSLATYRLVAGALSTKSADKYQGSVQQNFQCARRDQNVRPCRCLSSVNQSNAAYNENGKLCVAIQRLGIFSSHNQFLYGLWHDFTAPCYRQSTGTPSEQTLEGAYKCV